MVVDPWDGEVVWEWCREEQVRLVGIFNTHQHHDHIRGNAFLSEKGLPILKNIPVEWASDWELWAAPGHTCEHQVLFLKEPALLLAGDTLFQAGVGNCKNGGDPAALYHTITKFKLQLSEAAVICPGHDYLKKNLEFAGHVEPTNAAVQKNLAALAGMMTEAVAPLTWGEELQLNPFLRLNEPSIRERLASQHDSDEIVFKKLRQLRDNW